MKLKNTNSRLSEKKNHRVAQSVNWMNIMDMKLSGIKYKELVLTNFLVSEILQVLTMVYNINNIKGCIYAYKIYKEESCHLKAFSMEKQLNFCIITCLYHHLGHNFAIKVYISKSCRF